MTSDKNVIRTGFFIFWILASCVTHAMEDTKIVEFMSVPFTHAPSSFALKRAKKLGKKIEPKTEPAVALTGFLSKPDRVGPHPAVVLLHTCAGISKHEMSWAEILNSWGYVVLLVDSLTPRGVEYICDGRSGSVAPWNRALDAYGGKKYLSSLSYVDPERIAVMGMSHGAMAVLEIIENATSDGIDIKPFGAAVAFYPLCGEPTQIDIPTLIMTGDKDSWTPAELCKQYVERLGNDSGVSIKVFENAHHLFDHPDIDITDLGYVLRSNPKARVEAIRMVHEFLGLNVSQ